MKALYLQSFYYLFFLAFSSISIYSQGQGDPFNWTEPIEVESNDVFISWLENDGGIVKNFQKVYKLKVDSSWLPVNEMISKSPRQEDSRTSNGAVFSDAAAGRFNIDPYDDAVTIWHTEDKIEIMLPSFDTTQAMWTQSVQTTINTTINNRIYVRTGDFDGDGTDEFVVSYVGANDSIYLGIYDVDSTLIPSHITTFSDRKLQDNFSLEFNNYFIETADVNGDGTDEILLQAANGCLPCSDWSIYLRIYSLENNSIVSKASRTIQPWQNNLQALQGVNLAIVPGQFKDDAKEEIAFIALFKSGFSSIDEAYIYVVEVTSDLLQINFDASKRKHLPLNEPISDFNQLSLAAGDLNANGKDEIVFNTGPKIYVYDSDNDLNLNARVTINVAEGGIQDYIQSYNYLKVADVNQDNREDIIIVKNFISAPFADGFFTAMITVNDALTESALLGRLFGDEPQYDNFQFYSIAVGNFDGYNFRIGQPFHYTQTNVVQPIVLLKAPPVHFDMLDGQIYDVNACYNGGDCDFFAKYIKTDISSVEVSYKVTKDWGISGGIGGSGSVVAAPLGGGATFNYEAYLLYKHGRNFSKDTTNIFTRTIEEAVIARDDDQLFTTVTDYDLWEYPVYHGNEDFPRRSIMTLVPNNVRGQWFPSKSYAALSYIPDHEVGNILSYYPYDTLSNNPNVSQTIKATYISNTYTLGPTTSFDWYLKFSDFQSSQADTTRQNGIDFKASFIVIAQFDYTDTRMSTHKTSITQEINLQSHLGSVNMGIGDVKYSVTPYAYWAENDALIVDYAVKPELAPPGFPNTWWQDQYGYKSDPTFILPWKLDPEKGFTLNEPAKRYQTKDIIFSSLQPPPGDTLTITARVRNYSLIPTPSPVTVKFFIGDPDSGGVPIIGLNGTNTVSTNAPILNQGISEVEFKWVIPSGLAEYPRIYAVLDDENTIDEIHENNNKGFNVLGAPAAPTNLILSDQGTIPENYILYQNHPNPFNSNTRINYHLPVSGYVTLKIYDILGREIAELVNDFKPAGRYEEEFSAINGKGNIVSSGVYFYRLQSGDFVQTKKMMLLK